MGADLCVPCDGKDTEGNKHVLPGRKGRRKTGPHGGVDAGVVQPGVGHGHAQHGAHLINIITLKLNLNDIISGT